LWLMPTVTPVKSRHSFAKNSSTRSAVCHWLSECLGLPKEVAMTRFLIGFLVGLTLGSLAQGQTPDSANLAEQTFTEGGTVRLTLSSGDYAVRGAVGDHIAVRWFAEDSVYEADMKRIKTYIHLSGATATIRTEGPTKHARFTIDVPARSDLYLRIRAG